jgi:hydroxybutyrate-dimer hydrolase
MNARVCLGIALALAGCSSKSEDINKQPASVPGTLRTATYDGTTNDLLTGGLGKSGLGSGTAPGFADGNNPTAAELRTRAIYVNYRALVDFTANGGYGTFWGPNVDVNGGNTLGEGKIAGDETLAFADDGTGKQNVTMMVQVPATFDKNNACIVTGTSSGSRGIYGAIGTAGEWGLKHGCAVAYTDKGSGNGAHDLANNTVNIITGERQDAVAAGKNSIFTAPLADADRATYNTNFPNRFAFKHAHSQLNPEKDWGTNTLQAVELAYFVINEKYGALAGDGKRHLRTFTPKNTIVIASSVSNGAGAALAAGEQDTTGLIGGIVAGEPQVQMAPNAGVIKRGADQVPSSGKSLYDYATIANLYQPCAALAPNQLKLAGYTATQQQNLQNRCDGLSKKGLLTAAAGAQPDQANEAIAKLTAAGWDPDSAPLQGSHYLAPATLPVALTYANAYGKFSVADNLCNYSFAAAAAVSGAPGPLASAPEAQIFATGNGIPDTSGIFIFSNKGAPNGGAIRFVNAISPSTTLADYDLDGALCLRSLATGKDPVTGAALTGDLLAQSQRVQAGIAAVQRSGNLQHKPAILVQGRADTLVPINHASRAYYAANKVIEGASSQVSLFEIQNAQHFDGFLPFPSYAAALVPLHRYFIQSMDLMYAHLKTGVPLPASQVVRTSPRQSASTALGPSNVPPISATPAAGDQITFSGSTVTVPN